MHAGVMRSVERIEQPSVGARMTAALVAVVTTADFCPRRVKWSARDSNPGENGL